jgi:multiple sugar transport system permease protein
VTQTIQTAPNESDSQSDAPRPQNKLSEGARAERRLGWALSAPAGIVMLAVTAYPIAYAIYLSLQRSDLRFPKKSHFVGIQNYITTLSSHFWWHALAVTVIITVVSVAFEFAIGMALALVMHRTIWGRGVVRTVILVPYGIVTVAAAFSWKYAWTPDTGYLANLLPHGTAPLTLTVPSVALITLAEIWKTAPFMALLLLAGLALVPQELLNASKMDGAGPWKRFLRVMLPMMKPAILVALLLRTLDAFRIFDNIYILTSGNHDTGSVSILGYDNLFTALNLGNGSTISVLIFICVAIIAFIFIKLFGAAAPGSEPEERR